MTGLVHVTEEHRQAQSSLEEAAAFFSSPEPALRSRGETVFLHLRQSPRAVEHALFSLEHSRDPFVHFQCFSLVLEKLPGLPLRSPSASLASLTTLRDFILSLTLTHTQSQPSIWPNYTRSRAFQTFAAVEKRLVGLEFDAGRQDGQVPSIVEAHTQFILSQVVAFINESGTMVQQEGFDHIRSSVGAGLTSALLDELSSAGGGTGQEQGRKANRGKARMVEHTGLSPLQHRWTKAWMQEQIVPQLLQTVVQSLTSIVSQQAARSTSVPSLAALVNVVEKVLRWTPILTEPWAGLDRTPSFDETARLLSEDEVWVDEETDDDDSSAGQAGSMPVPRVRYIPNPLAETFLTPDLIALITSAYRFASQLDTLADREAALCVWKLRRCMMAVATFAQAPGSSVSFSGDQRRAILLETSKALQDESVSMPARLLTDHGNGLLFLAQLYAVVLTTNASLSADTSAYGAESVLRDLSALTSNVLAFAFDRRGDSDEEDDVALLADETVRSLLTAWLAFLDASQQESIRSFVRSQISEAIVKPYINARLHHAASAGTREEEDDELGEEVQSDQEAYEDTLIMLATLARQGDLSACLAHLRDAAVAINADLTAFYGTSSSVQAGAAEIKALESRWESLHWLLLITGHVVSDVSKGEVAMVPREIMALPLAGQEITIRLIQLLGLNLTQTLTDASPNKPQSPQVLQSLLWFNARWVPGYLLIRSTPTLSATFDGAQGQQLLAFLLTRVERIMALWLSDGDVILQVSAVLRSFALSEGVMQCLLSMVQFEQLVKAIIDGLGVLPAKTHKALISALVGCIYASASTQSPEAFFAQITHAIEVRLASIVHQPNFTSSAVHQRAEVVDGLMNALDMFDGLASSTQPKSSRAVFGFLSRFFDTFVNLTDMYKARNEVSTAIIRILRTLIGALDLGFGVEESIVHSLNDVVWRLLDGVDSTVLVGDSPETALEEDLPFEGLCLVLELVYDLLLASDGDAGTPASTWLAPISRRQTGDVCLFGFSRLVPVLQGDVLSVLRVRTRLAKLTSRLFLSFGHRLTGLVVQETLAANTAMPTSGSPQGDCARLYQACVQALALSLGFDETNAVLDGLEACDALSQAIRRVLSQTASLARPGQDVNAGGRIVAGALLAPLLDTVLRGLLLEPLAPSMLEAHIHTLEQLFTAVITTTVSWPEDGKAHLTQHLQTFCTTTSLTSLRASGVPARTNQHADVAQAEGRRRESLAHVISQLAELCIALIAHANDHGIHGQIEAQAREVAWNGRLDIQMR